MSVETALSVAAPLASILFGLAPIAQMRLIAQRGSTDGISATYWVVLAAMAGLWLTYGLVIGNTPIIAANIAATVTALVMLGVLVRYRERPIPVPVNDGSEW